MGTLIARTQRSFALYLVHKPAAKSAAPTIQVPQAWAATVPLLIAPAPAPRSISSAKSRAPAANSLKSLKCSA